MSRRVTTSDRPLHVRDRQQLERSWRVDSTDVQVPVKHTGEALADPAGSRTLETAADSRNESASGPCGADAWAIVLAAGQGRRLECLTTDRLGRRTPKQFCSLAGDRTLLDEALDRAFALTAPARTLVVVAAEHRAHWAKLVQRVPAGNVLVQPRDRGTAAGFLLPLCALATRDPLATVVCLPSDHHVLRARVLETSLRLALRECRGKPWRVTLLGITPDAPETEFGWIVPAPDRGVVRAVARFVEKPPRDQARELLARGALWNSFLMVGAARSFLDLIARRQPRTARAFSAAFSGPRPTSPESLERLYASIPSADLSGEVLQGSERFLRVQLVPPCGWTDLGTPRRVAERLRALGSGAPAEVADAATGPPRLDLALAALGSSSPPPVLGVSRITRSSRKTSRRRIASASVVWKGATTTEYPGRYAEEEQRNRAAEEGGSCR